jgi:hypothetical protein
LRLNNPGENEQIIGALRDRRGWWRWEGESLKNGMFGMGTYRSVVYYFPAVRLASIALTGRDHVAKLIDLRNQTMALAEEHRWAFQDAFAGQKAALDDAVIAFRSQVTKAPDDEFLWSSLGNLELRLGNLREAEVALNQCLDSPSCREDKRAGALYNLACVFARTDRPDACRPFEICRGFVNF